MGRLPGLYLSSVEQAGWRPGAGRRIAEIVDGSCIAGALPVMSGSHGGSWGRSRSGRR